MVIVVLFSLAQILVEPVPASSSSAMNGYLIKRFYRGVA